MAMRRRRKPLLRWEPTPYIATFLFLCAGSIALSLTSGVWQTIVFVLCCAGALAVLVTLVVRRPRTLPNPNGDGALHTLDGLDLVEAQAGGKATRVRDTHRYQAALASIGQYGDSNARAVLVPGATRWLGRELRVGIEIADSNGRAARVGFLSREHDERWLDLLAPLRDRGMYVVVPARIVGRERPFTLDIDLGGVDEAVARLP